MTLRQPSGREKYVVVAMETTFGKQVGVLFERGFPPIVCLKGTILQRVAWEIVALWSPIRDNRRYIHIAEVLRHLSDSDIQRVKVRRKAPTKEEMEDAKD